MSENQETTSDRNGKTTIHDACQHQDRMYDKQSQQERDYEIYSYDDFVNMRDPWEKGTMEQHVWEQYADLYQDKIDAQNASAVAHGRKTKTLEEFANSDKGKIYEKMLQIGNIDSGATKEETMQCARGYLIAFNRLYGPENGKRGHIKILSVAVHNDEQGGVHLHVLMTGYVDDIVKDKEGRETVVHTLNHDGALKACDVPIPDPEYAEKTKAAKREREIEKAQKLGRELTEEQLERKVGDGSSRYNCRLMAWSRICQDMWNALCARVLKGLGHDIVANDHLAWEEIRELHRKKGGDLKKHKTVTQYKRDRDKAKNQELMRENQALRQENEKLKKDKDTLLGLRDVGKKAVASVKAELSTLKGQKAEIEADMSVLTVARNEVEDKISALTAKQAEIEASTQDLELMCEHQRREYYDLTRDVIDKQKQVDQVVQDIQVLRTEFETMQLAVGQMNPYYSKAKYYRDQIAKKYRELEELVDDERRDEVIAEKVYLLGEIDRAMQESTKAPQMPDTPVYDETVKKKKKKDKGQEIGDD